MFCFTTLACDTKKDQLFVSPDVEELFMKATPNANATYKSGINILKIAKTSREYSYGFSLIADGLYKKEEYSKALIFYKKVDSISILLNDSNRRFMTNLFKIGIYHKVGLLSRADESLKLCQELTEKSTIPYARYYLLNSEASQLEMRHQYCEAISKRQELLRQIIDITNQEGEDKDKSILVVSYIQLAYVYIKCGQLSKAGSLIIEADKLYERDDLISNSIITAVYKMVKGMYASEVNDYDSARLHFNEALKNARENNLNIEKQHILRERMSCNFDQPAIRKMIVKEFNELEISRRKQMAQIIEREVSYKNVIISKTGKSQKILLVITSLFGIAILLIIKTFANSKKIANDKFNKLVLKFEEKALQQNNEKNSGLLLQSLNNEISTGSSDTDQNTTIKETSTRKLVSEEKEIDLLTKLEAFEKGDVFLQKNFSISIMATQFETNSKYINFVLRKHRGKSFSDYINSLRILYITELLYKENKYRNFKISYLSELCGYSSHSRFASIFKSEIGLSPSEFISKIAKK